MNYTVCPDQIIDATTDECREVLLELGRKTGIRHLLIGFVTKEYKWHFPEPLMFEPMQTMTTDAEHGLIGHALLANRVLVYPDDQQYRRYFIRVDSRTQFEIAAPVLYSGQPSAVLLADVFEGERIANIKGLRDVFESNADRLSKILDSCPDGEPRLRRALNELVGKCVESTSSTRGYLAIRKRAGSLEYFDLNNRIFLELNPAEGLCGAVFRSGELLNVPDVWKHELYVASDSAIQSEIVAPIVDQGETIAILNMESIAKDHFNPKRQAIVEKAAADARELALKFRGLDGTESIVSVVTDEMMRYEGLPDLEEFARFLGRRINHGLGSDGSIVWIKDKLKPRELNRLEWDRRGRAGFLQNSERQFVIHAPIRTHGDQKAVIGILVRRPPPIDTIKSIEQICRIGGRMFEIQRQMSSSTRLESILHDVVIKQAADSITLYKVVVELSRLVSADHCTLLARSKANSKDYLLVVASTADEIYNQVNDEMFYRIGEPFDGFTGYVGTTGIPIHVPNLSSPSIAEEKELEARGLRWKKGISEEGDPDIAAFVCQPILAGKEKNVLGVMRLHRTKAEGQQGDFDKQSQERIELVCAALGRAYETVGLLNPDSPRNPNFDNLEQ